MKYVIKNVLSTGLEPKKLVGVRSSTIRVDRYVIVPGKSVTLSEEVFLRVLPSIQKNLDLGILKLTVLPTFRELSSAEESQVSNVIGSTSDPVDAPTEQSEIPLEVSEESMVAATEDVWEETVGPVEEVPVDDTHVVEVEPTFVALDEATEEAKQDDEESPKRGRKRKNF